MKKVLIYRVEREDGEGPYYGKHGLYLQLYIDGSKPVPNADDISIEYTIHRCAFNSLYQYKEWFNTRHSRQELNNHRFFIYEYEVDKKDIKEGKHQIVFKYDISLRNGKRRNTIDMKYT